MHRHSAQQAKVEFGPPSRNRLPHLVLVRPKQALPAISIQDLPETLPVDAPDGMRKGLGRFYTATPFLNELLAGYLMVGSWYVACLLTLTFKNWLVRQVSSLIGPFSETHRPAH